MEENYALGLDLGTTFSCIGVYRNGEVEIIPNRNGDKITPSMVTILDKDKILCGEETLNNLVKNYDSTIYAIKRFIGRNFLDSKVQNDLKKENFPFKITYDSDGKHPSVEVTKDNQIIKFSLEEISSFVIKKLVESAQNFLKNKINQLVITVPANFNVAQRNCTEQAAKLADIKVLRIINEPTAAALAYGLQNKENTSNGKILVFDLGGGTFDVTILKINKSKEENFEVISTKGNKFLGGEDFDNKLVDFFLDKFCKKFQIKKEDIFTNKKIIKNLKISCENIKRVLSVSNYTTLNINNFYNNIELNENITREEFEEICDDLFMELKKPLEEALQDAHIGKDGISEIVLVGGSTRIPKIKTMLKDYFGKNCKINDSINPDEAVAYGATLMAAKIVLNKDKFLSGFNLLDITPLSLGIEIKNVSTNMDILKEGLLMSVIIKRASQIPHNNSQIYETVSDYQKEARIVIYEGEKKYVKYNHKLGELILKDLTPKPKGQVKIKVKFFIDVNGILDVTASELSEKGEELRPVKTEIEYQSIGLNDKIIEQLKEKNKKYFDKIRIDLESFTNTREALKEYEDGLKDNEEEEEIYYILMNYKTTYEIFIDKLDKDFENETMFERYYLHLKELFEYYVKIFNCNPKIDSINEDKEAIIEKIKDYLKYFTEKISGYLFFLLDILKSSPKKYFFEIVVFTIEQTNIKGKKCLEERKEFCRYNCLTYFERSYLLFTKYIENISKMGSCPPKLMNNCKEQIRICLLYLDEVRTNSILLLEDSIKEGKLIKSHNSGFTNSTIGLKFTKDEEKEKNEIILQNYEKMLREIKTNNFIKNEANKNPIKQEPNITEAICIANIIKISYSFLGNGNFKRFMELGERCQFLAKNLGKTGSEWYKEFDALFIKIKNDYKDSENSKKNIKDTILKKYKDKFDEVDKVFNEKKNNKQFIEFILKKYPFKGYKNEKMDYSKEQELLLYLRGKYHPDQYKYNNDDENSQFQYFIIQLIESYLNNMYENIQ